jgi:putative DNA primase/helicase
VTLADPAFDFVADHTRLFRVLHPDEHVDLRAIHPMKGVKTLKAVAGDEAIDRFIHTHCQQMNVYMGVATRGINNFVPASLHALFADFDFKDSSEASARERVVAFAVPPSIVIQSGGGLHVYWLLDVPLAVVTDEERARAKRLLRRLARALDADAQSAEPAHILRVPGTLNHKYTPSRRVVLEVLREDLRYSLTTLDSVLPEDVADTEDGIDTDPASPPLPDDIEQGNRNALLFRQACRLRRLGYNEAEIASALAGINQQRCHPPLEASEIDTIARSASRYKPVADAFPLTEVGDAEFFAAKHGDHVRFDHLQHRWLVLSERTGIWIPDPVEQLRGFAVNVMRDRQRYALTLTDKTERNAALRWATAGEATKRINNALREARAIPPIADDGSTWDTRPFLLGTLNGVVDLETGVVRMGRPDESVTMRAHAVYDASARCPLWERTLTEVFEPYPDLVPYMQRALGYSLTGDCREECFFVPWGDGGNGKGTVMNTVGTILGDYRDNLPFSSLELRQRDQIPADMAKLKGKRFVTSSESSDRAVQFNVARIKALTGRDPITARFMRENWFTFQPVLKLWLAVNTKPKVDEDGEGFWRRIKLVPFTQSFVGRADATLKDRLMSEASGILTWMVRGALDWQRHGMQHPPIVDAVTEEYRRESEPLAPFIDERCVVGDGLRATVSATHAEYQQWCHANGVKDWDRLNQKAFSKQMRNRFQVDDAGRHTYFLGLGLRSDREGPRDDM